MVSKSGSKKFKTTSCVFPLNFICSTCPTKKYFQPWIYKWIMTSEHDFFLRKVMQYYLFAFHLSDVTGAEIGSLAKFFFRFNYYFKFEKWTKFESRLTK